MFSILGFLDIWLQVYLLLVKPNFILYILDYKSLNDVSLICV